MATGKSDDVTPERPPIPGDLPYREPPVIEGKAQEIHETSLETREPGEQPAGEPSPGSMDELKAAVENALDSDEPPPAPPPPEARETEPAMVEPRRSWPVWPLALAALIGLLPGLAALSLALQPRQDDTTNAVAALRGDVGRLNARVDALEKRPDAAAFRDNLAALDKRLAGAETLARNAQAAADKAAADAKAASSAAQTAADRPAAAASAPAAPPPDLAPLREQLGKTDNRLQTLDQKLASVDQRIGALQAKIDQPKTDARAPTSDKESDTAADNPAALAVVAQSVQQALPRGTPFPTELSALKALKADPAKIAALEAFAQSGAPTARALADRFRPLADEISKQNQPAQQGSFFERIAQSASHLVRVRSAGEKEGSDPAAIASQIQTALDRGDLNRAHDLWTKLPDSAKARAQDFGHTLDARVAADNAAQSLASEAIGRVVKSRS